MWNKAETASFDTDMQLCFTEKCPDELPVPGALEIVEPANDAATLADTRAGCKCAHPPGSIWEETESEPQLTPINFPDANLRWKPHGRPGTLGFKLIPGLPEEKKYTYFVWKGVEPTLHPYGGCYHTMDWRKDRLSTGVIEVFKCRGVKVVILNGLATEYCVTETGLQFLDAGFIVVVNLAACRGMTPEGVAAALDALHAAGAIIVDDVMTSGLFTGK